MKIIFLSLLCTVFSTVVWAKKTEPKVYTVVLASAASLEAAEAKALELAGKLEMRLPQVKTRTCNISKDFLFVQASKVFADLKPGKFVVTSDCFTDISNAQDFLNKIKTKVKGAAIHSVKIRSLD